MKKFIGWLLAALLVVTTIVSLAACGGPNNDVDLDDDGNIIQKPDSKATKVTFWANCDSVEFEVFKTIVSNFNAKNKGAIEVKLVQKSGSDYSNALGLSLSGSNPPDVFYVGDSGYKAYAELGYLMDITELATKSKTYNIEDMWENVTERYKYDVKTGLTNTDSGRFYGVPKDLGPTAIFYNEKYFERAGITVISVDAADLDAFNNQGAADSRGKTKDQYGIKGTVKEKGYFELGGKYYFNNQVPMSWDETVACANKVQSYMRNKLGKTIGYGYFTEWWFNYGWSVGGDVMGFNGKSYDFTLMDKSANYIVVDDNVSVNGSTYNKGDIIRHEDKVNADMAALVSANKVYAIASQYEAVFEYVALQVGTDKNVDTGSKGYGVATPETSNAENNLTNGTTAMTRTAVGKTSTFGKFNFVDYCPAEQYRVYEGGSTYQHEGKEGFANEYLKVIGETYDGEVYTGALKVVNGTKIVGKQATASISEGLAIPACSDPDKYQAAWNFISWVATKGQTYLAKAGTIAPVARDVLFSDKFAYAENDRNMYAVAVASANAQRGDWGYFESGQWVTDWANTFNQRVRRGLMTISDFDSECNAAAVKALDNMYCIIRGIR